MIYFDNSATTAPSASCIRAMNEALTEGWGNPSSLHRLGIRAEQLMNSARSALANELGCTEGEIYFTSGGTEANSLAVLGAARAMKRRGLRVITSETEHHSVAECFSQLEREGFEVIRIRPDSSGRIDPDAVAEAINDSTVLISIMLVNNETGAVFPVSRLRAEVKRKGSPALIHTDAVQAFGKLKLNVRQLGVDLMSVSGHKIHGPKGVGALYKSASCRILPITHGGGQERGLRNGTEPLPAIAGLGAAVGEFNIKAAWQRTAELNAFLRRELCKLDGIFINSPEDALPYILNISVTGYRSETLLHFLEAEDIYVSSGSACAKGESSHVLRSAGLSSARTDSALRLSFSSDNTVEEAKIFIGALGKAQACLRRSGKR